MKHCIREKKKKAAGCIRIRAGDVIWAVFPTLLKHPKSSNIKKTIPSYIQHVEC